MGVLFSEGVEEDGREGCCVLGGRATLIAGAIGWRSWDAEGAMWEILWVARGAGHGREEGERERTSRAETDFRDARRALAQAAAGATPAA